MGEVYLARDTRLGRDVALKVIPAAVAADRLRLERFTREARALAALTHPAIGAIYDVAEHEQTRALVLELVEGDTLDQRLKRGPLSIAEALTIARTVAEALDAAHDKGLVHRDLKPGNIKLTPAGDVKVLDFGLAKMLGDEHDATIATVDGTIPGVILGTAAYMSPEQARGQAVDKRADVWAFGCLLFEMLSGRPAFGGGTWSDSIARTLTAEPDWALLPAGIPPPVVHLVERCLQKDPKQRLRGLGGVELALDDRAPAPRPGRRWSWTAAGVVLALTGVAASFWRDRPEVAPANAMTVSFEIPPSVQIAENGSFALSPDGRRLVFIGTSVDGRFGLWERSMESLETTPISGAEGELGSNSTLFWSPDSRVIGFYADGAVKRIDRRGGQVQLVCRVPGIAVGGTWNQRDEIVVGNTVGGLLRCPAAGGDPIPVVEPDEAGGMRTGDFFPVFLPDGRRVLYLRLSRSDPSRAGLYLADLDRPAKAQNRTRLIETGFGGRFAPAGDRGHILFMRNRGLWAVPFDTRQLVTTGEPFLVVESIGTFRDWGFFDTNGHVLVHREGVPDFQLTVRDRRGGDLGWIGEAGHYTGVALSPDGRHVAARRDDQQNRSAHDLWLIDVQRNTTRRLTSDGFAESVPAWTPDSQSLVYASGAESAEIQDRPLDGGQARTLVSSRELEGVRVNPLFATTSVGAGGEWLAYSGETRGATRSDIWMIRMGPTGERPTPIVVDEFDQTQPALAPNGAWLAYVSNESGVSQVMMRPLRFGADGVASAGGATAVSRGGGQSPRWRADGKELYFRATDGGVMAAAVGAGTIGTPARLFTIQGALAEWGVASNGERFVFAVPDDVPFTVVLNWQSGLR